MPVPVTILEFPAYTSQRTVTHAVWYKRTWQEDWQRARWLWCDQCTWCCAPSIPTAQLDWDYGYIAKQGEFAARWHSPLDRGRYFIKIETECHTAEGVLAEFVNAAPDANARLTWYGTLEVGQEQLDGIFYDAPGGAIEPAYRKMGHQKLQCFGLAQLLARTPIEGHWWSETTNPASQFFSPHPATFNQPDSQGRLSGNRSSTGLLTFSDKVGVDDLPWSSRNIFRCLLYRHSPQKTASPSSVDVRFQWDALDVNYIPDWDQPVVSQHGKSVWQILNEILHRGRLLTFYVDVRNAAVGPEFPALEVVEVHPVSLADVDLATDEGTLLANQRQFSVHHHQDRACLASLRENTLEAVDQFIFRGARRASIVSMGYRDGVGDLTVIGKGWTAAQELEYEAAASGAGAGYGPSSEAKQQQNAQSRARPEVFEVFRRFQISDRWSLTATVRDGRGGTDFMAAFPAGEDRAIGVLMNPRDVRILPTLPIKDGYDYTGISSMSFPIPAVRLSLGPHENIRPLVFFKIPDQPTRWIEASQIGTIGKEETSKKQNHKFSCRVVIPQRDKAVLVEVTGQPQHVIAYTDFSPLPVDPACGQWEWRDAVFTIALEDPRYCEGRYPSDGALAVHDTELRRVVLYVGDDYRTDYIAPHTALGVHKETGALTECTVGGYCQDDRLKLLAKAKLAHDYYSQGRNSLALLCDRPTNAIGLGDLIKDTSQFLDPVGSIVSQITLTIPAEQSSVTFEIETAHAELDFLEHVMKKDRFL